MRYTAVFEFPEGIAPAVGVNDSWLGGKICAVQFSDALYELEKANAVIEAARDVVALDWSENDTDCVADMRALSMALDDLTPHDQNQGRR